MTARVYEAQKMRFATAALAALEAHDVVERAQQAFRAALDEVECAHAALKAAAKDLFCTELPELPELWDGEGVMASPAYYEAEKALLKAGDRYFKELCRDGSFRALVAAREAYEEARLAYRQTVESLEKPK